MKVPKVQARTFLDVHYEEEEEDEDYDPSKDPAVSFPSFDPFFHLQRSSFLAGGV